jgi:hypothetical protein
MAKIWFCYEGDKTYGPPRAECSLKECEDLLGLLPSDYYCDRDKFSALTGMGSTISGFQKVLVEVGEAEAAAHGQDWKGGIYYVRMPPAEVEKKLTSG